MKQIAIAGLGVVGGGVADLLVNHAAVIEKNAGEEVRLKAVFTRTKKPDSRLRPILCRIFPRSKRIRRSIFLSRPSAAARSRSMLYRAR